ncbi:MAG: hypothetical protein APF76_11550 [Desulfitibacter sp. BRH_c19]|nr:MAG: hypothetical protein APF76_11550 [Desulfitibacter sp. BRH_c19]
MYYKNLLEQSLKELNISYKENKLTYTFEKPLAITIATPQTYFSFKSQSLKLVSDDDFLYMDFDNDFIFKTQAPFVSFAPAKNNSMLIRLSHNKF